LSLSQCTSGISLTSTSHVIGVVLFFPRKLVLRVFHVFARDDCVLLVATYRSEFEPDRLSRKSQLLPSSIFYFYLFFKGDVSLFNTPPGSQAPLLKGICCFCFCFGRVFLSVGSNSFPRPERNFLSNHGFTDGGRNS